MSNIEAEGFRKVECGNCDWVGQENDCAELPEQGIFDRVGPGEIMPVGECPDCGAACHYVEKPNPILEMLVTLQGAAQWLYDDMNDAGETHKEDGTEYDSCQHLRETATAAWAMILRAMPADDPRRHVEFNKRVMASDAPKTITAIDVFQINDIAAELIDELARKVQHKMGVTDGGFAGQYFSGDEYSIEMAQIVGDYADAEFKFNQNSDDEKDGAS